MLLVSAGVLAMLFARVEGRDFHLPGGDGLIVMIAGGWAALLIFYRLLDKPGLQGNQRITATVGVQWGFFLALVAAGASPTPAGGCGQPKRPQPPACPRSGTARARARSRRSSRAESHGRRAKPPSRTEAVPSPRPAAPRSTPAGARRSPAPQPCDRADRSAARVHATRRRRPSRCPSRTQPPSGAGRRYLPGTGPGSYHCADDARLTVPGARLRRRSRRGPARGGLPAGRVDRARLVPGDEARQAGARRGPGGGRQDRAGEGAGALSRPRARAPAVLRGAGRGEGAVRVELPQAAAAHPGGGVRHRLGRRPGGHLRRGVPARAAADDRDRLRAAGRAADRRDRQDRPGVRGDAARGALRLPDLDPGARAGGVAHAPGRAAHLQQLARADRGAQAPLPVPLARLPRRSSTSSRSCACTRPSCPRRSPAGWSR